MPKTPKRVNTKRKIQNYEHRPGLSYASQFLYTYRNIPPCVRRLHVPAMQRHHRLSLAMSILKGMATSLSRFWVEPNDAPQEVKDFVVSQINRFWTVGAPHMLEAMDWGWAAGETMYRYDRQNQLNYHCFQKFRALDVTPVTLHGDFAGLELRNQGQQFLGGMYAFWHTHGRDHDRWWGRSKYEPAYTPWFEMSDRNGAIDCRRHYYYRHSFQGEIGRYPEGSTPNEAGEAIPNRDIMARLVENARSGGTYILPSQRDENGNPEWDIIDRTKTQTSHDVREYISDLLREATEGMGVSEEVFQAADTGSGYSGRKIPEQAIRAILSQEVFWLVFDFDEQVIRPLVRMNFGTDENYEIIPFGLIDEDQGDETPQVVEDEGGRVPGAAYDEARRNPRLKVV